MNQKGKFTIGTDFEGFIVDKQQQLKSAIGIIQGTKHEPIILENGAGLHYDNVCIEVAGPVADDEVSFRKSINISLAYAHKHLPKQYGITFIPSTLFPEKELESSQAKEFGCNPDYNAWTLKENPSPNASDKTLRSSGAHISIGYLKGSGYNFLLEPYGRVDVIRTMDCLIGLPSVLMDSSTSAKKRRELYGKAGAHRPRTYGVEYRTLSNFWIKSNRRISLIYHMVKDVLNLVERGEHIKVIEAIDYVQYTHRNYSGMRIEQVINTGSQIAADNIVQNMIADGVYSDKTVALLTDELGW